MNITLGEVEAGGQQATICEGREGENAVGVLCRDIHDRRLESEEYESRKLMSFSERREENLKPTKKEKRRKALIYL